MSGKKSASWIKIIHEMQIVSTKCNVLIVLIYS